MQRSCLCCSSLSSLFKSKIECRENYKMKVAMWNSLWLPERFNDGVCQYARLNCINNCKLDEPICFFRDICFAAEVLFQPSCANRRNSACSEKFNQSMSIIKVWNKDNIHVTMTRCLIFSSPHISHSRHTFSPISSLSTHRPWSINCNDVKWIQWYC